MKIPSDKVDFAEEGYTTEKGEPLWLKVPRSVREGYVYTINTVNARVQAVDAPSPDDARELAGLVLDIVAEWNFDDQAGKPLPVLSSIKDDDAAERQRVIAEIPMEVIQKVIRQVTGQAETEGSKRPA